MKKLPLLLRLLLLVFLFCSWTPVVLARENKTYVSQKYSFAFDYPPAYELKVMADSYLDFKKGKETLLFLQVDDRFIKNLYGMLHPGIIVIRPGEEDPRLQLARETCNNKELFHRYVRQEAQNWCMADGPDGSVYCEKFKSEKPFTSRGGLDCLEFQLITTREDFNSNTKTQQEAGPVFAVYLPQKDLPVLLMISPVYGKLAAPAQVQEMREIIDSIRMTGN